VPIFMGAFRQPHETFVRKGGIFGTCFLALPFKFKPNFQFNLPALAPS